jgi:hypothetical protein
MTSAGRSEVAPAEDMEDMDPGLARERTDLAWTRTTISFAALGSALLKTTPIAGILVLGMSALVWGLGRMSHVSGPQDSLSPHRHRMITLTVTLVSSAALVVTLLGTKSPLLPR